METYISSKSSPFEYFCAGHDLRLRARGQLTIYGENLI